MLKIGVLTIIVAPYNPAGKLLLKCLAKLAVTPSSKNARIAVFQSHQPQFEAVFSNFHNRRIFQIDIVEDWLSAKIGGFDTIYAASRNGAD